MRVERRAGPQRGLPPGMVLGGLLLVAALVAAVWFALDLPRPICHLKQWTGVPCPTCGSTRLIEALLEGDLTEAVAWNPLAFLVLVTLAVWVLVGSLRRLAGRPDLRLVLEPGDARALLVGTLALIFADWIYLILRGV